MDHEVPRVQVLEFTEQCRIFLMRPEMHNESVKRVLEWLGYAGGLGRSLSGSAGAACLGPLGLRMMQVDGCSGPGSSALVCRCTPYVHCAGCWMKRFGLWRSAGAMVTVW